jgi:hypothetical protein
MMDLARCLLTAVAGRIHALTGQILDLTDRRQCHNDVQVERNQAEGMILENLKMTNQGDLTAYAGSRWSLRGRSMAYYRASAQRQSMAVPYPASSVIAVNKHARSSQVGVWLAYSGQAGPFVWRVILLQSSDHS